MGIDHQWEINLPDELVKNLEYEGYDQNVVQLSLAIFLFMEKKVSLERAAFLSGLPLIEFMELVTYSRRLR
jgi:predicted HTH domain antitoxin